MEERLVPVNATLGLVTPGGLNRAVLAEAGFRAVGLEIPCVTSEGKVVVDVVLAHAYTGHLIACEAKCGSKPEHRFRTRTQRGTRSQTHLSPCSDRSWLTTWCAITAITGDA